MIRNICQDAHLPQGGEAQTLHVVEGIPLGRLEKRVFQKPGAAQRQQAVIYPGINLYVGKLASGLELIEEKVVILTAYELFGEVNV